MSISHKVTLTAFGLILVVACSSDKSASGDGSSTADESGGSGAKNGTSATNGGKNSSTSTNGGKNSSTSTNGGKGNGTAGAGATATNGTSTSSTGSTGAGSTSSTGSTGAGSTNSTGSTGSGTGATGSTASGGAGSTGTGTGTGSTGSTADPVGGSGNTADPPAGGTGSTADPVGGSGNTADPVGGSGNTADPVGGAGNTADPVGGTGNTGDPAGGKGNTGDPAGGTGNTGDPAGGTGNTNDPPDECVPAEMNKVNVIVFEDATPSNADSEGGMYVGGNFTTPSSYSIGAGDESQLTCADYSFIVDGNISGTALVKNGKAAYGGELLGTSAISVDCKEGAVSYPDPNGLTKAPVDFAALETKFIGYSTAFKNYPATAGATATLQWGTLTFSGSGSSLYVFNITAEQINSATSFVFKVENTSSVIINVSGTSVTWSGGFSLPDGGAKCKGTKGAETGCERILWNFYEAQTIKLAGIGVQGTILAPYATQSGDSGNVDGQVIVKYLTGGIEYHPYYFNGCLILK